MRAFPNFRVISWCAVLAAGLLVAGCGGAPKPTPPTVVRATVAAMTNVNPDASGRPSPIVVRVFELRSLAAFQRADFFSLWDKDREMLGPELLNREEYALAPGERRPFNRQIQPETRYIAVIAAFRDLQRASWRGSVPIVANKTTSVAVVIEGLRVVVNEQ